MVYLVVTTLKFIIDFIIEFKTHQRHETGQIEHKLSVKYWRDMMFGRNIPL